MTFGEGEARITGVCCRFKVSLLWPKGPQHLAVTDAGLAGRRSRAVVPGGGLEQFLPYDACARAGLCPPGRLLPRAGLSLPLWLILSLGWCGFSLTLFLSKRCLKTLRPFLSPRAVCGHRRAQTKHKAEGWDRSFWGQAQDLSVGQRGRSPLAVVGRTRQGAHPRVHLLRM